MAGAAVSAASKRPVRRRTPAAVPLFEKEKRMSTYLLFGTYTQDSLKKISPRRTSGAAALIRKNGGELKSGYALLGDVDIVLIADFPDNAKAMKASIELTRTFGIGFKTAPAVSVEFFDNLMA
jgi:uncharacterized protein with GYD domain